MPETTDWTPVPRQLTDAMRDAFWRNMTRDIEDGIASAADKCWADMLAAAPRAEELTAIGEVGRLRQAMKAADENGDAIGMRVILREALQQQ